MKYKNKGFTLVELLVAFAILSVLGVALVGFVISTSNSYRRNTEEVDAQYEQQFAVNHLRDVILECGRGISYDDGDKLLTVYNSPEKVGSNDVYPVSFIKLDATNKQLLLAKMEFADKNTVAYDSSQAHAFAGDIKDFKVDLSEVEEGQVTVDLVVEVNGKERRIKEKIALRNNLVVSNDAAVIWKDDAEEVESFIESVSISRGMKTFSKGDTDEIGKTGETVEVVYTAQISASEFSTRNYAVDWALVTTAGAEMNPSEGISYTRDGESARVIVESSVATGKTFRLVASSKDDPSKDCYVDITVTDNGVYAQKVDLILTTVPTTDNGRDEIMVGPDGKVEIGNGYYGYYLSAELTYTDGTSVNDPAYFDWKVELDEEEAVETPEDGEETEVPEVEAPIYDFDEKTGRLVLYTEANGRTITVTATAKERTFNGQIIFDELPFTPLDIPEYDPGTVLVIGAEPKLSRGGVIPVELELFNGLEGAVYEYQVTVEPMYESGSTQWDGSATNSDFDFLSFTQEQEYDADDVSHEEDLGENTSINIACDTKLNWSYQFVASISATATDQDGNVIEAQPVTITIPVVGVILTPTTNVPDEVDSLEVITNSILRYEDWYFQGLTETNPAVKYTAARRWFDVSLEYLEIDDADWTDYTMENSYMFMNQIGVALNKNSVTYPTSYTLFEERLSGFKVQLFKWVRLANRPTFMNYTVTIRDQHGNSQSADTRQFTIVYDHYPKKN